MKITRVGLGEDAHRLLFVTESLPPHFGDMNDGTSDAAFQESYKPLLLANLAIDAQTYVKAKSDGDILLHALCRALETLSGQNVLGTKAEQLLAEKNSDSRAYLAAALTDLSKSSLGRNRITQISVMIEAQAPKLLSHFPAIRANLLHLLNQYPQVANLQAEQVGITAMTGDDLTDYARGNGMLVKVLLTVETEIDP